ncbi:hypothetical protein [Polaromonas sp. CG9_12]|nr:hypothetical protein [Polaromonas sp. CG9_12]
MSARTFAAVTVAALLAFATLVQSGPDELQAEQEVADYKAALADGGVSLCAEFHRVPTWTKSGDLVCRAPVAGQGEK